MEKEGGIGYTRWKKTIKRHEQVVIEMMGTM